MKDDNQSLRMAFHTRAADFRAVFVSAASAINTAREQVALHENALYHFSELVVCTNLLTGLFHNVRDTAVDISTSIYFQKMVVEAQPQGSFRAACQINNALTQIQSTKEIDGDIKGALFHVTKRYYDMDEPVRGTIQSRVSSIPNLTQQYLHESEQIATLMLTGMKLNRDTKGALFAERCFGLLIEALPDVSEEKKFIITDNLERLSTLTQYFDGTEKNDEPPKDVMDLLDDIYPGEQWIQSSETPLVYRCSCHREGYLERILELARKDMESVFGDLLQIEVKCGYCGKKFYYKRSEIESLL
ncbi:MAG: 33 kDa chaperonin [Turneriella sp.]|nr:33 kDa chaperonin [Turneriella sp.]